jgi:hypothetical protein
MGIWSLLILLAGKMPAPQEILGYFFIWKSLSLNIVGQASLACFEYLN